MRHEVGDRVRIAAHCGLLHHNGRPICGMIGTITDINGAYHLVRPYYQRFEVELYSSEIKKPSEMWWGYGRPERFFVEEAIRLQKEEQGWTSWEIGPDGRGRLKRRNRV